jgi:predicted RNase H-like HicB family nuclease
MTRRKFLYEQHLAQGMARRFSIIIEQGEDDYLLATVVELPGCHTQAKTQDELLRRTKEAIALYLSVTGDISRSKFLGLQHVEV